MSEVNEQVESIESITEIVDSWIRDLHEIYDAATCELDAERDALEEESQGLQAAADELKLLLPAKAREAAREADALTIAGDNEAAKVKLAEASEAANAPAAMSGRQQEISGRLSAIRGEKEAEARSVFEEWFPELREALVGEQRELCEALSSAWSGIQRFAIETGTQDLRRPLASGRIRSDLTARETGPEKPVFKKLLDWFGGRR